MKTKNPAKVFPLLLGALVLIGGTLTSPAQSTQETFDAAKKAYYRGDLELAKAGLERVLSVDPRHTTARAYLGRINYQIKNSKNKGTNSLEAKLGAVIVPTIDFKEATLGSVFEFLPKKAAELTENKFEPSIIFKGPAHELEQKKITLKLTNVPMTEVLRYIGELTEVQFDYQKYAVVVTPRRDVKVEEVKIEKEPPAFSKGESDPFGGGKPAVDPFR